MGYVDQMINLAEACGEFNGQNYRAVGICHNNIGNLQYQNEKYKLAAESYSKAVHITLVCLGEITPDNYYETFPNEKPANGYTQVVKSNLKKA